MNEGMLGEEGEGRGPFLRTRTPLLLSRLDAHPPPPSIQTNKTIPRDSILHTLTQPDIIAKS